MNVASGGSQYIASPQAFASCPWRQTPDVRPPGKASREKSPISSPGRLQFLDSLRPTSILARCGDRCATRLASEDMTGMKNILVAEDDRSLRDGLVQAMSRGGYKVHVAQTGREAIEKIERQVFDLVIAGQKIGGHEGLEVVRKARASNAGTMVIVTGDGGNAAAEAMRSGAFDFVQRTMSLDAIELKIQRAIEHQRLPSRVSSMAERQSDPSQLHGLMGPSAAMRDVFKIIDKVASSN